MIEEDDNISEPWARVNLTIILSPRLASQALKVKRISLVWWIDDLKFRIVIGINRTVISIIPSKHRRVIRRWSKFIISEIVIIINEIIVIDVKSIELREISLFDLQDHCFYKAFNSWSVYHLMNFWYPRSVFFIKL